MVAVFTAYDRHSGEPKDAWTRQEILQAMNALR